MTSDLASRAQLKGTGLAFRRGNDWLFKELNFTLCGGEILWLRGANGCGKTSLLRIATGLLRPDAGTVRWEGQPLTEAGDFVGGLVYIGHTHGLKDDLSAMESLAFLAQLHGRATTSAQLNESLKRLGVHHRRHQSVRVLSQGQRKRVALARLAAESTPGLWILDEPFDALDSEGIEVVNSLLNENIQRGGSVMLTSHIPLALGASRLSELHMDRMPRA